MKRLMGYCVSYICSNVLWVLDYEVDIPGYSEIEAVSDLCDECKAEEENSKNATKHFDNRFGTKHVNDSESFDSMMQKRKIDNRKKSGKGPGRANR